MVRAKVETSSGTVVTLDDASAEEIADTVRRLESPLPRTEPAKKKTKKKTQGKKGQARHQESHT